MSFDNETLRQYEAAIEAAHNAGDANAALELARDLDHRMTSAGVRPTPRYQIGQAGMPEAIREVAGAASKPEQAIAGVGTVLPRAAEGLQGLAGGGDPANRQNLNALAGATTATQLGSMAGNFGLGYAMPTGLATTGLRVAGSKVPAWLASRPAQVADTGLSQAGINAAIEPGEPGDRFLAGGMGLTGGVFAPGVVASGQGARRVLTKAGRAIDVGENIAREAGPRSRALIEALTTPNKIDRLLGTRSSSFMVTDDPAIRVLESGSRAKRGDLWMNFDKDMGSARWEALQGRAGTPEELAAMKQARNDTTGPMREGALASAMWNLRNALGDEPQSVRDLGRMLDDLATGEQRPNSSAQTLVKYVRGQLDQRVTPDQLYTVRKELTDGIAAAPTSELSQAARAARPQRMQLINQIDTILDDLSGGKWRPYMETYKAESGGLTSKESLLKMVEALRKGQPEGAVPAVMGERPGPATLGRLRDKYGEKQFGGQMIDRLEPEDRGLVNALIDNLKKQSEGMIAPSVLGSHTGALVANMGRANAVTEHMATKLAGAKVPVVGSVFASKLFDAAGRRAEEELAQLLQDPQSLAAALRRAEKARRILIQSQKTGGGAGMTLSGAQRD